MTDNEILNALIGKINLCKELNEWGAYLSLEYLNEILDLIKRYRAEIKKCVDTLCKKEDMTQLIAKERQQYYDELQAAKVEIERLHTEAISDVLKKLLSLEDVYAKVEGEFVEWDPCVELEYLFPREFEQAYSTEEEGDPE